MISRFALQVRLLFSPALSLSLLSILFVPAPGQTAAGRISSHAALTSLSPTSAPNGRFLVIYRNGQISASSVAMTQAMGARLIARHELLGFTVVDSLTDATRAQLALDPNVEAIVPDILLNAHTLVTQPVQSPAYPTADALYHSPQGWAVRQVGGFGADGSANPPIGPWNTTTGSGIRIAILDSGVDPNHPDIAPNLALNLSEVVPSALPSSCDDGTPLDQQGHGTWTASLAAGALGPTTGLVVGVAPSASILNIKVLQRMPAAASTDDPTGCLNGEASGLMSWVLQGIEDAVANGANIVSMSLGVLVDITTGAGAGEQLLFNRATEAAYNAGVVLVAAAGNDAFNAANGQYVELPAQATDVLAIIASTNPACAENLNAGATCQPGPVTMPYYSNYGAALNALAAPGGSYPLAGALVPDSSTTGVSGWVTGACSSGRPYTLSGPPSDAAHSLGCFNLGHNQYVQAIGTSASAPLVAGAAALMLAANPNWSAAQVVQQLRSAAVISSSLSTPQATVSTLLTPPN